MASHVSISSIIEKEIGGIEITQDLLSDMADLSADIQLQYGKMPGSLELAVIKAKQLGINMAQLNTTGQNLLNIESSIGQEMEYQLLLKEYFGSNENRNEQKDQLLSDIALIWKEYDEESGTEDLYFE